MGSGRSGRREEEKKLEVLGFYSYTKNSDNFSTDLKHYFSILVLAVIADYEDNPTNESITSSYITGSFFVLCASEF